MKNRLRLIATLIRPSASSFTISTILSCLIIGYFMISFSIKRGTFFNFLSNSSNSLSNSGVSQSNLSATINAAFANHYLDTAVTFLFWMGVGLIVFLTLSSIINSMKEIDQDLKLKAFVHFAKRSLIETFVTRTAVRLLVFIAWVIFVVLAFRIILPFCALSVNTAISDLHNFKDLLMIALAALVLFLSLNVQVIFLRLELLRLRIWSDEEVKI